LEVEETLSVMDWKQLGKDRIVAIEVLLKRQKIKSN
jgi:hypothetical protein